MEIMHLEKENFNELIKKKVLVDFYTDWCGICKMTNPVLKKVDSKIKVIKVDAEKFEDLSRKYGIMSVPTLILFNKGKEVKKHIGFIDAESLKKFLS